MKKTVNQTYRRLAPDSTNAGYMYSVDLQNTVTLRELAENPFSAARRGSNELLPILPIYEITNLPDIPF